MSIPSAPAGYVPFEQVRASLPEPRRIALPDDVELETLHLPGPDPSVVFVHGGLGSLWNPYPQLASLRGERGLLTYSLAGNGESSDRPEQTVTGHVTDLRRLLDELDIASPIVHGHSYGTAIAIEYAKRHPTSGLVLHAGGDHDLTPAWEKPFMRLFLAARLYRVPVHTTVIRILATSVGVHDATPRPVVEDFLKSNPMPHRRSAWETVTEAFWGYDGRANVERIDVPTLVVHGPADGIVPMDVARATAGHIPGAVFCRLERAGHIGYIERPAAYIRLLRALVRSVEEGIGSEEAVLRAVQG